MPIDHVSAVTLPVADMRPACAFYAALGFQLKFGGETMPFTSFYAGQSFLNLDARRTPSANEALTIFHVDDVDVFYAAAVAAGLEPDFAPNNAPWGERYFHMRDPDGHLLSFATPLGEHGLPADYPEGCAGVDGCRGGWVAVTRGAAMFKSDLAALLSEIAPATVAVDIPIGLADNDKRACDGAARAVLGARRASVFRPPARAALAAMDSHENASQINSRACGYKLSAQTFHLLPKIAEADALLRRHSRWRDRVHEAHPELCFAAMAGTPQAPAPLSAPKRSWIGARDRMALIARRFGPDAFDQARAALPDRNVADDDIGDAFACLYTAERIATNAHVTLPTRPPRDACDLPLRICY